MRFGACFIHFRVLLHFMSTSHSHLLFIGCPTPDWPTHHRELPARFIKFYFRDPPSETRTGSSRSALLLIRRPPLPISPPPPLAQPAWQRGRNRRPKSPPAAQPSKVSWRHPAAQMRCARPLSTPAVHPDPLASPRIVLKNPHPPTLTRMFRWVRLRGKGQAPPLGPVRNLC